MSLRLHYAIRSDVGHVREGNEDSAYAGPSLLAVADGMGGHAAGEVASSTVISALAPLDEHIPSDEVLDALTDSIRTANARLRSMSMHDGSLEGMGTTVTAMLFSGTDFGVLHVGDSRGYLLRDDVLVQFTHDHTLVQDLVDQGRITPEQANTHPQRSLLMRALDGREVEPDLDVREAMPGDRYLLCTDGLSGVVSEETILDALLLPTPQNSVDRLVELALKGGGPDNVTVVVADVVAAPTEADDEPLVAGAAAEKEIVPGAVAARSGPDPTHPNTDSAAARAARIGRVGFHRRERAPEAAEHPPDTGDDDDGGAGAAAGRPRQARRVLFVSLAVIVLVVAGVAGAWAWVNTHYYVGVQGDRVAVFRGVEGDPIPGLGSTLLHVSTTKISDLHPNVQATIRNGVEVAGRADGVAYISRLEVKPAQSSGNPPATPEPAPTKTAASPGSTSAPNLAPTPNPTSAPAKSPAGAAGRPAAAATGPAAGPAAAIAQGERATCGALAACLAVAGNPSPR